MLGDGFVTIYGKNDPKKYPMMAEAQRQFDQGGDAQLDAWTSGLSKKEQSKLLREALAMGEEWAIKKHILEMLPDSFSKS
jgi:hypothetical protein